MRFLLLSFANAAVLLSSINLQAADKLDPARFADEPFAMQHWPPARVLVWANPGVSGVATEATNWTEYPSTADYRAQRNGRPAEKRPNRDSDIILPEAPDGKSYVAGYTVEPRKRSDGLDAPHWSCRHVTIGRGAGLDGGCGISRGRASFGRSPGFDTGMGTYGNVLVEDGGYIYGQLTFLGDKHTFFHIGDSPESLGKLWIVRKEGNASITLLSKQYELAKGLTIESGRLVLHDGCRLGFGAGHAARIALGKLKDEGIVTGESYVHVHPEAALEMRAGSRIGRITPPENAVADIRLEGLLQIGRPGAKSAAPAVIELGMAEGAGGFLEQHGGFYIRPTAEVRNLGGLVIASNQRDQGATTGKGISVFLEREVELGKVHFDHLRAGGISAIDEKTAKQTVSGATFGEHCGAEGADLFSTFSFSEFSGGPGTVEFIDGLKTECRILFPHAGRLVVRSKGFRTLQSFDLESVHTVTVDGRRTEFNARRALNSREQGLREKNALWGDVPSEGQVGKYGAQEWPDCPVMIWRRPGVPGTRFTGPNWLDENGRPYFEVPLISQRTVRHDNPPVDMLLPGSEIRYEATGWGAQGNEGAPPHRHLTIEDGASYGSTFNVQGNLWMKHGSGLSGWHRGRLANRNPDLHRFLRFEKMLFPYRKRDPDAELVENRHATLGQWGHIETGDGGTLEVVGRFRAAADRLYVDGAGTLIISEGSEMAEGARSGLWVMPGATLALLQDAVVGTETTRQHAQCYSTMMISGTLKIGLPGKPIRRDMLFPLSGVLKDSVNRAPAVDMRSAGSSFVLSEPGRMEIHSADPRKARVVFKMHDSERAIAAGARYSKKDTVEGLALYFAGRADLDGVLFDDVLEGCLMVSPEQRARWKNVFFGEDNFAEPEKLYRDLEAE